MFEFKGFTEKEYLQRLKKLQDLLRERDLDLAVLNAGVDLYYYTGSVLPLYLVVPVKSEPFLLARKAADRIRVEVRHLKLEAFSGSRDLANIFESAGMKSPDLTVGDPGVADLRVADLRVRRVGFNFEASSHSTVTRMLGFFPPAKPVDISMELKYLRMRKSNAEIGIHEEAGRIIAGFPSIAKKNFKPGMTELELSQKIEEYFRLSGNEIINTKQENLAIAYGVCSAGKNSLFGNKFDGICSGKGVSRSMPFGASRDVIPEDVPLIMDYAFILNGYHMDMTRMASRGKPQEEILKAYNAMLEVREAVIKKLRPGIAWKDIHELSENLAGELGFADEFMGYGRDKTKFVGHGVGLQLDEPPYLAPKSDMLIESGMTIAVEPKVSMPEVGVVGIEDTFLVTDDGARCLTECSREWMIL